ncbi:MAG: hypothetical protein GEV03_08775 [Streptosporangiales bacterium]|nr:hypothetical protein [Streptosporangiales bacterium]
MGASQMPPLQGMSGSALLDAAARMVNFPWVPSKVTEPIDVAQPQLLEAVREDWARAADAVDQNILDLDRASLRVLDNWVGDSAKAFYDYVTDLIDVVEAQHTALRRLSEPLERVQRAIEDAQRRVDEARNAAVTALLPAAAAGVSDGVATPGGAAVAPSVRAIVGTLTAYVSACSTIRNDLERVIDAAGEEMQALAAGVSEDRIREVTAPPPPQFSNDGFRSVNEPDELP